MSNVAPAAQPNPCDMLHAMLSIKSDAHQRMYEISDDARSTELIVQVLAPASLVPPQTRCPGHSFRIFHGERDVDWMIVQLRISKSSGGGWHFMVSRVQPNPRYLGNDTFEHGQSYNHAVGGFVEWTGASWRAFTDSDRYFEENARARGR